MLPVYQLTLRQLSGRWRIGIMSVLATLPVLITWLILSDNDTASVAAFENIVLSTLLVGSIVPLVVLAIAAPAFGNEVEDRTLANLALAPMPRWHIALPKLLATITVAGPFIAGSAILTAHLAFLGQTLSTVAVLIGALAAVAMYGSLFVWLGLVSSQAIGIGVLYIVLWEGFFSGFVSGVRLLSIRHYAMALMHAIDERRFAAATSINTPVTLILVTLVTLGFLLLTIRQLRRMDVP